MRNFCRGKNKPVICAVSAIFKKTAQSKQSNILAIDGIGAHLERLPGDRRHELRGERPCGAS
jgi:hypothetical protein